MKYKSSGKLMLTGEYLALDNALVLALPTKKGQSLEVEQEIGEGFVFWNSYTNEHQKWFSATFKINAFEIIKTSDDKVAKTLVKILETANNSSLNKLDENLNYAIDTRLEFSQNWGLGSSSTLISNIALWFNIDALQLHFSVFNGSGYDVACADSKKGITYQINDKKPLIKKVDFAPEFRDSIFFVHLNKKQNSYQEIKDYKKNLNKDELDYAIRKINLITEKVLCLSHLEEFEALLLEHEAIVSKILKRKTVQQLLFSDYQSGIIKSLGAWGGDFVLVTGGNIDLDYFRNKGYQTIIPYTEMIL